MPLTHCVVRSVGDLGLGNAPPQPRLISRALRHNAPVRTAANPLVLVKAVETFFPAEEPWRAALLQQLTAIPEPPEPMAVEEKAEGKPEGKEAVAEEPRTAILPEVHSALPALGLISGRAGLLSRSPALTVRSLGSGGGATRWRSTSPCSWSRHCRHRSS